MNDVNVLSTPAGWNGTFIRTSLTHGRIERTARPWQTVISRVGEAGR